MTCWRQGREGQKCKNLNFYDWLKDGSDKGNCMFGEKVKVQYSEFVFLICEVLCISETPS